MDQPMKRKRAGIKIRGAKMKYLSRIAKIVALSFHLNGSLTTFHHHLFPEYISKGLVLRFSRFRNANGMFKAQMTCASHPNVLDGSQGA
jgi:hypothetical protein